MALARARLLPLLEEGLQALDGVAQLGRGGLADRVLVAEEDLASCADETVGAGVFPGAVAPEGDVVLAILRLLPFRVLGDGGHVDLPMGRLGL
jgi:hypothetical protein